MYPPLPASMSQQLALIEALRHSNPSQARQLCAAFILQARQQRQPLAQILATEIYGQIMDHEGRILEARNLLFEATQQALSFHDHKHEAKLLETIARSYYSCGDYRPALQYWARCVELTEDEASENTTWMLAKVGLGQIYDALGDYSAAVTLHQAAANRINEVNDPYLDAKIQINLAVNLKHCERYQEARSALNYALQLCQTHQYHGYAAESLFRLAEISLAEQDTVSALPQLEHALELARSVNYRWGEANILGALAQAYDLQQQWPTALKLAHQGQHIAQSDGFIHILARLHLAAAHYAEAMAAPTLALSELKAGFRCQQQIMSNASPEQKLELEQRTGLRPSQHRILVDLSNRTEIERGKLALALQVLTEQASRIVPCSRISFWQLNTQLQTLQCQHAYDLAQQSHVDVPQILKREQLPVFFAWLEQGKSLVAHEAAHHFQAWELEAVYLQQQRIKSLMAFSVRSSGFICGALLFEQHDEQHNWTPDEVQYGSQIRDIATRAIANNERRAFQNEIHLLNAKLQENNEALEERVEHRTRELALRNQELQQAMEKLVQSEKLAALGSLVAGIAHELNTPLGAGLTSATLLSGESRLLQQQLAQNVLKKAELGTFLSMVEDAGQLIERNLLRACDLVTHFKQVAVDTASTRRRQFDLCETINEVIVMLYPQLKMTRHQVNNQVAPGIVFDSYPGPLEQILSNLILNSLLHGFEHVEAGQITISTSRDDANHVCLHYQDNGAGISDELQKHVFDPFFTTKLGKGGSGLGLYIVYNLVTGVLGGQLQLRSEAGQYTHFMLSLPLIAPEKKDGF